MTSSSSPLKELSPAQRTLLLKRLAARKATKPAVAKFNAEPCLSSAQERWLFQDQLAPADPAHAIFGGLRLRGKLNLAALQGALDFILARHEPLRSKFFMQGETPQIRIHRVTCLPLSKTDISGEHSEQRLQKAYESEVAAGFALDRDLPIRVQLLHLAEQEHALLFAMHHIASDGWSLCVFLEEFTEVYGAIQESRDPQLPKLGISYTDYSHWQHERQNRAEMDRALDYWKEHLGDAPVLTDLRSDQSGAGLQKDGTRDLTGEVVEAVVPAELAAELSALASRQGSSVFATLLTAYFILISRVTGEDDLVIGTPVSGRILEQSEPLIGLFLNTLALRAKLESKADFVATLAAVNESVLRGLEYHELPFDRVVKEIAPSRQVSGQALFELMFNFTPSPPRALDMSGLSAEFLQPPTQACKSSAVIYVTEWQNALELRLHFQKARFSRGRIRSLLNQYICLLQDIVSNPHKALNKLSLSPQQALPKADAAVPQRSVSECIAQWAEQTPEALALEWNSGQLDYAELNSAINQTAQSIRMHGLDAASVVAVSGGRSARLIIGMAATLRAGCVLMTLDPALPQSRQASMLKEADAQLILVTDNSPQAWLADSGVPVMLGDGIDHANVSLPEAPVGNRDPAYLFFTSGTTGTPKAILGSAAGLAHFLDWQRNRFDIGPGDRAGQLTGLSFDVLLRDVFTPLTAGATLVLPSQDAAVADPRFLNWLLEKKISLFHTVPSVLQNWLLQGEVPPLPDLRLLFSAGEPLYGDLVTRWRAQVGNNAELINLYGPTETTLAKCAFVVPEPPFSGSQPVGQAIPGAQALVLRQDHRLCAPGEQGEIAIRTAYGTLGYANDPALTAQQFIANPETQDATDWLYLTGDLGWCDSAGRLHVVGRKDDQVKIRGIRVEPEEISALMRTHPDVEDCAVVAHKSAETVSLAAYAVPALGCELDLNGLRHYLQERLPEAMVPQEFSLLDALPLTANHKLDRAALPRPSNTSLQSSGRSARSRQEMQMLQIWSDVLGKQGFGVEEDFFELGGHSLLALRLLMTIEQRMGVKIPLPVLFQSATVAHLAKMVENQTSITGQVVPLWTGGAGQPLWLIHTGGGTIWNYMPLVAAMAPDFPVYAIQAQGFMDAKEPQNDMHDMAASYVALIRDQQSDGPYRLGGHSFGGLLAWEVAHQLRTAACDIEVLLMMDTRLNREADLWVSSQSPQFVTARDLAGAASIFARFTGDDTDVSEGELAQLPLEEQITRVSDLFQASEFNSGEAAELVASLLAIAHAHRAARLTYSPPVLDVPIVFLQARDNPLSDKQTISPENDWQSLAATTYETRLTNGDHVTMMTDRHAPKLAQILHSILE